MNTFIAASGHTHRFMQLQQLPNTELQSNHKPSSRKHTVQRLSQTLGKPDFTAMSRHYALTGEWQVIRQIPPSTETLVVFLVDSSGSMLRNRQIAAVKGLITQTVAHYHNRDVRYALVTLTENTARMDVPLTSDGNSVIQALDTLPSGGKTNLRAGLELVRQLFLHTPRQRAELCIFTDGRINAGNTADPFAESTAYFRAYLKSGIYSTVTDTETGPVPLKLAARFARETGCKYRTLKATTR